MTNPFVLVELAEEHRDISSYTDRQDGRLVPVRGGHVQDAAAQAAGTLHLPLLGVSQADELGVRHERHLPALQPPGG